MNNYGPMTQEDNLKISAMFSLELMLHSKLIFKRLNESKWI